LASGVRGDTAGAFGHGALGALDIATVVGGVKGIKSKGASGCSFAAGTPVLLANGTSKPIDKIELDDQVVATDPETGDTTSEPVEALFDDLDLSFPRFSGHLG
jgi:hypothetical protein